MRCTLLDFLLSVHLQGWDDCLDAVMSVLCKAESLDEAKNKVEQVQVLVKAEKFEYIRKELGVINDLF